MWTETYYLALLTLQVGSVRIMSDRLDYMEIQNITAVPYAVLVFSNNNKYFCTGSIVHPKWVLTAAHCLFDMNGEHTEDDVSITVVAGADSLYFSQEDIKTGKTQIRQSVVIKVHSGYSWYESFVNDLVIVQVKDPFVMTGRVQVAPLRPVQYTELNDGSTDRLKMIRQQGSSSCRGFGFGKVLREANSTVDFWLKAQDYEVDRECHCLRRVRSTRVPYNILKRKNLFLCDTAGLKTGLCKGDNGGPLMCDGWLRGISTAVVLYTDMKDCILQRGGQKNDCGAVTTLSFFTDICYLNLWLRENIPDYPCIKAICNPNPKKYSENSFY